MPFDSILWDLDDDPDGNVQHCAEHGVTKEEVEEVFQNATDADVSRSSVRPVVFGDTNTGKHLMVVYEVIDADTVYPVTAYEVPEGQRTSAVRQPEIWRMIKTSPRNCTLESLVFTPPPTSSP